MRGIAGASLALVLAACPMARGEHAKINLDVIVPGDQKTAFVDQTPPPTGKNPRPVIKAKVGEPIKIEWSFTNVYPHKTLENVVLHFYVAPVAKVGQKELPKINDDVVVETGFEMDFKPGARSKARTTIKIDKPGVYMVRVESVQTGSDHEHFAAIDLVVDGEK
jgi:hypothetical protein